MFINMLEDTLVITNEYFFISLATVVLFLFIIGLVMKYRSIIVGIVFTFTLLTLCGFLFTNVKEVTKLFIENQYLLPVHNSLGLLYTPIGTMNNLFVLFLNGVLPASTPEFVIKVINENYFCLAVQVLLLLITFPIFKRRKKKRRYDDFDD